jgi:L-ascorbate metabolism protein UlaG (beta-lactamase superfamily)
VGGIVNLKGIELTWLGHSTFRIQTPEGKTLYIDPWIMRQSHVPGEREERQEGRRADLHSRAWRSHRRCGDVGKKLNPIAVVGIFELCLWLQKKGVKQIAPMNKGGTQTVAG